jgi:DNA-binding protein YbaB
MKKTAFVLSTLAVAASLPTSALAATTVSVSNNGGNSSATVNVQNSFNSTSNSTNTTTSNTKVRIETNGEVKEYESSSGEDVHMESEDGTSKVNITNKGTKVTTTASPTAMMDEEKIEEKVNKATEEAKEKVEKAKSEQKDFFKKFEDWIKNFFKNLF